MKSWLEALSGIRYGFGEAFWHAFRDAHTCSFFPKVLTKKSEHVWAGMSTYVGLLLETPIDAWFV